MFTHLHFQGGKRWLKYRLDKMVTEAAPTPWMCLPHMCPLGGRHDNVPEPWFWYCCVSASLLLGDCLPPVKERDSARKSPGQRTACWGRLMVESQHVKDDTGYGVPGHGDSSPSR